MNMSTESLLDASKEVSVERRTKS